MRSALIKLHIAICLWGCTGILGALINLNEVVIVYYRFLFTFLAMFMIEAFSKEVQPSTQQQKLKLMFTGSLQSAHWICFFASIQYANVAVSLICLSATSFFSLLLDYGLHKTQIKPLEIILSLFSIVGIFLLFYSDFQLKTGIIFGILSALFVALVPVFNKAQLEMLNPPTVSIWNMAGGLIFSCIAVPIYLSAFGKPFELPSSADWWWLLILSLACTVLTWRLSLSALKTVSPFTFNLLLNLEPLYGIGLAYYILDERKDYNLYTYIGIAIILITILIQTRALNKKQRGQIS